MSTPRRFYRQFLTSLGVESTNDAAFDKERAARANFWYMLNTTSQMFSYSGLPSSLPVVALERILQNTGGATIVQVTEKPTGFGPSFNSYHGRTQTWEGPPLYAFPVNFAEAPDPYGEPYQVIVTSPGFTPTISRTYTMHKEAVVMKNDTYMRGIAWLHWKYAWLLAEAELSLQATLVTLRDHITFVVRTSQQKKAVEQYLADLAAGKYGAIMANDLGSPIEPISHDGRSNAVELAVNGVQAIKAAWLNAIGLNPSMTLKREYMSAQEIDENTDALLPAIDDMLECRQRAVDEINDLFGTNITVEKSSAWAIKQQATELSLEQQEAEVEVASHPDQPDNSDPDLGGENDVLDSN